MKPIVRNIIAVVAGWLLGGIVNGAIVQVGMSTYPSDVDTTDYEALSEFFETASFVFFLYPLIAHAAGALIGGFVAALISKNRKYGTALIVGGLFFLGGVIMMFVIPAPGWFTALDLLLAYFPMALLGAFFAKSMRKKR